MAEDDKSLKGKNLGDVKAVVKRASDQINKFLTLINSVNIEKGAVRYGTETRAHGPLGAMEERGTKAKVVEKIILEQQMDDIGRRRSKP